MKLLSCKVRQTSTVKTLAVKFHASHALVKAEHKNTKRWFAHMWERDLNIWTGQCDVLRLLFYFCCSGSFCLDIWWKTGECSIIRHPPSQLIRCQITNCQIIESNYIAKYSSSPINYPFKPVGLCNVSLLGVRLSSIPCIFNVLEIILH